MSTKTIAQVNQVSIEISLDKEQSLPIRPICEAIGVDFSAQKQRIERDEILNSVVVMTTTTGKDGKQYEMMCLPFKFIFGWLFTIDTSRVREEAKENVIKYKLECYNALYDYFTAKSMFIEQKQNEIDKQLSIVEDAKSGFKNAKNILSDAETKLKQLRMLTMDDFDMERRQLKMDFGE